MLTEAQEKWINHLSDTDFVSVIPHDPTCEEKFLCVEKQIQNILGIGQRVLHRGASALGISGQDEIDIYVPIVPSRFDETTNIIAKLFGAPRSHYPLERARFVTNIGGKHIDVFVINEEGDGWKESEKFYHLLMSQPDILSRYRNLKESLSGKSTREYYRSKTEFINELLRYN